MQKCDEAPQQVEVADQQQQEDQGGAKKRKSDLKSLLSTIKFEKREEAGGAEGRVGHSTSRADQLACEFLLYKQM